MEYSTVYHSYDGTLKLISSVLPSSKGYISQYTPQGAYKRIFNDVNQVIISLMIVKNYIGFVLGLKSGYTVKYTLRLPSGFALGNSSGKGTYLTVYPSSHPNTDTVLQQTSLQYESVLHFTGPSSHSHSPVTLDIVHCHPALY